MTGSVGVSGACGVPIGVEGRQPLFLGNCVAHGEIVWLGSLCDVKGVTILGFLRVSAGVLSILTTGALGFGAGGRGRGSFLVCGRMSRLRQSILNAASQRSLFFGPESCSVFPCILVLALSSSLPIMSSCPASSGSSVEAVFRRRLSQAPPRSPE